MSQEAKEVHTHSADILTIARTAICALLDGDAPNGVEPSLLGDFAEGYEEMCRAYEQGGTKAARKVFDTYAKHDSAFALLRATTDTKQRKTSWTIEELLNTEFEPPRYVVPGYICEGLTVFAGRPKLGKSWAALQIAVAVGTGGVVFGERVEQGKVLYLALEDNPRRIKGRLQAQRATAGGVQFEFEWKSLAKEGMADLIQAIDEGGYSLVIIDTITRALGGADQMDQAEMNLILGTLQRIALDRRIAIVLVDHHRKTGLAGAGDVIDDIMGATSKAGVADAAIGIYRQRGQKDATLKVSGRDIDDKEVILRWDVDLHCWQLVGEASDVREDTVQAGIIECIRELGGQASLTEIADWLNQKKPNVFRELNELIKKGKVIRGEKEGKTIPYRLI